VRFFDRNTWFWLGIGALFFLPFLGGVHLFDWDEINFAELAREMTVSGDWLRLQINFERFTEKPPLFFWLQALAMSAIGVGEYAARLPNALLGMVVLPFLYLTGKFLLDRKFGFLWALSWFGSILPFLYFKSGIIDPFFNFFIFNGLLFSILYCWKKKPVNDLYFSRPAGLYLFLAGLFIGLAILTKGPVAYLLLVLTLFFFGLFQGWRNTLSISSLLRMSFLALAVFLLWFGVDWAFNGPDFLIEFTIRQWELLTRNDAGHGGFPGYHFVVLLFGCFPASIFALRGLGRLDGIRPHVQEFQRWMITLLLVVLVLFSLVNTKIVHYSSMAYYPLTFLCALSLWHYTEFPRRYPRWISFSLLFVGLIALVLSFLLPWAGMHGEEIKGLFAQDPFAQANLEAEVHWSVWDFMPGIILVAVLGLFFTFVGKFPAFAFRVLFFGMALWCMSFLIHFIGKIEAVSQRAAVEFFTAQAGKEVYVTTYGYKSYVPWFYAKVEDYPHEQAAEKEWLFHGATDRDVYISTKINRAERLEKELPDAEFLYAKNGFYFYRRKGAVGRK